MYKDTPKDTEKNRMECARNMIKRNRLDLLGRKILDSALGTPYIHNKMNEELTLKMTMKYIQHLKSLIHVQWCKWRKCTNCRHSFPLADGKFVRDRVFLETNFRGAKPVFPELGGEGGGHSLELKYTN